jgi:hypothetical protein
MAFASGMPGSLIDQTEHALHDESPGFLPDHRPLYPGLPTAFGNRFGKEDNGTNDFVVVLNGVNELEFILRKVLCRRHARPLHQRATSCASSRTSARGMPRTSATVEMMTLEAWA